MFLLFCFAASKKFELTDENVIKAIEDSYKSPMFLFFYKPNCPRCKNLPELFNELTNKTENENILLAAIDCSNSQLGMALGVTALPHFIFISSPNPNYWFHSRSMTLPKMEDLIHRYVTPNVTKITSSSQTTDFIKRVRKGGSVFQLTVPEEGHPLIQQFTDISIKYLGLYCTFIYDINPEVTSPTLTVYRSTECSLSFSISDESQLEQIIEQYRFSHYRSLNWYEWNRFFLQSPSIVFLNNRNTVEKSGAHDLFKNISKEYCNKMEIGINDVGKEVTILTNTHQPAIEETNVLYAYPKKQCSLMKSYKEGFEGIKAMIEGAENDEKCMKFGIEYIPNERGDKSRTMSDIEDFYKHSLFCRKIIFFAI